MKHENITLSFPSDLKALLYQRVSNRGVSKFVAEAVRKSLEEYEREKELKLEKEYKALMKDASYKEVKEDWKDSDQEMADWEW